MGQKDDMPETVIIMRDQAIKLMSLHVMIRDQDLQITQNGFKRNLDAEFLLEDVAQECALQLGGMHNAKDDDAG